MDEPAFTASYRNDFGDNWIFEFSRQKGRAVLKGSDVDWFSYPVIEGEALGLVLSVDEVKWLMDTWTGIAKDASNPDPYNGRNTKFSYNPDHCFLTENYCPICLEIKSSFDRHHCIWAYDGGTDDYFNLLKICCNCHVILTHGCAEDRVPRDQAAFYHQMMYFGVGFFPRSSREEKRHAGRNFLKEHPIYARMVEDFDTFDDEMKLRVDEAIKALSRKWYIYYREMASGIWSWDEHHARNRK